MLILVFLHAKKAIISIIPYLQILKYCIKLLKHFVSNRTALAEAELEYNENHISPSVYVRVRVNSIPTLPNLSDKRSV